MSILEMHKRPLVAFNAKNADHRRWFATFTRTKTWMKCPYRFIVTDSRGQLTNNLVVGMSEQVTQFYLDQEFKQKKSYYKRKASVNQSDGRVNEANAHEST